LAIARIESSYFDDRSVFPEGSVTLDNGLLMRGIDHEWHSQECLPRNAHAPPSSNKHERDLGTDAVEAP
jgi:hypothetical protein